MRILLVADAASPNITNFCCGLAEAGADIDLASFAASQPENPVRLHLLPDALSRFRAARYVLCAPFLRRIAKSVAPDVVVGYYATGYGTAARLVGRRPLIEVAVGNDVLVNPRGTLTHRAARRNLRSANLVIAWSAEIAAQAVRLFGCASERIVTFDIGIPVERFHQNGSDESLTSLVSTRALDPYYKNEVILQALAICGREDLKLEFIGDGPARATLSELARRLGLENRVQFTGSLPSTEIPSTLEHHGVYVSSCPTDGTSASLQEAMAAGLIPVVVDNAANRSWIDSGRNGWLVRPEPQSVADALNAIARLDRTRAQEIRKHNRNIVLDRADRRRNAKKLLGLFESLLR